MKNRKMTAILLLVTMVLIGVSSVYAWNGDGDAPQGPVPATVTAKREYYVYQYSEVWATEFRYGHEYGGMIRYQGYDPETRLYKYEGEIPLLSSWK